MGRVIQSRREMADYYGRMPQMAPASNGDETRYANRVNSFSKTLRHNHLYEVLPESYDSLLRAIAGGRSEDFDDVLRGGSVRFKNPLGAFSRQFVGIDQSQLAMPPAPRFDSAEQAAEMVEVYWQALARDVPFARYDSDPVIGAAAAELSRLSDLRAPKAGGRVTASTIFRGLSPGETVGPFVSQFLLLPAALGAQEFDQKLLPHAAGQSFMTTEASYLEILLGLSKGGAVAKDRQARYISTARDLVTYVHEDYGYSPYYAPAWTMLHWGNAALSNDNPYLWSRSQDQFLTFGQPDALEFAARGAKPAFHAAWWQKWMVHRRARPEVYASRVHTHQLQRAIYPLPAELLGAQVLEAIRNQFGSWFLPQAYPEGSPAHSAYPSGHATVAGAAVTMLKAFFNESFVIPDPVVPSEDGSRLLPYRGADLTIGGELNKLAFNIAMARNFAGIHWRTDAWEGLRLGEQVAIHLIHDIAASYAEDFGGFTFTRFDGTKITVNGVM